VLNPIRFERIPQGGVLALHHKTSTVARCTRLVDVAYLLEARFELTDRAGVGESVAQHLAIFRRRAARRNFFKAPFLGLRDLAATVSLAESKVLSPVDDTLIGPRDLGWMLYDREPTSLDAMYFRARMVDGVIDTALPGDFATAA